MNTVPRIKPAAAQPAGAERIDPLEWETRVDLAACYRLVDLFGMCDLHLNHISARVPGQEEHFLINPFGMAKGAGMIAPHLATMRFVVQWVASERAGKMVMPSIATGPTRWIGTS